MRKITKKIFGVEIDPEEVKTPYQLYRKLRPQYFSDSTMKYRMNRQLFKQVMSELSTEMKQDAFEQFTYQLVCRLITPNLIPQTGPMGGGDGKVDFETYPVDDAVSSKWYIAGANKGTEKWAFAVSCVAQWEISYFSNVDKERAKKFAADYQIAEENLQIYTLTELQQRNQLSLI